MLTALGVHWSFNTIWRPHPQHTSELVVWMTGRVTECYTPQHLVQKGRSDARDIVEGDAVVQDE